MQCKTYLSLKKMFKGCLFSYFSFHAIWYDSCSWLRFFRAFSSVVRQMPGWCPQRRGTARTLPNIFVALCILFCCSMHFLCCSMYFFVLFYVMSVLWRSLYCLCVYIYVLNNCHRVATQLQLSKYNNNNNNNNNNNTNTLHVQIMSKNCTIFPPAWLGG
jgi:hypothetical protein